MSDERRHSVDPPTDARLSELLRSLPREDAPPYFTAGVLRRLDATTRRAGGAPGMGRLLPIERFVMAAAAVALVAAAGLGLNEMRLDRERQHERRAAVVRLEALEAERTALETELATLRSMAREAQPTVHLSSAPEYDVVLDMTRLARRARERSVHGGARLHLPNSQGENR